MRLLKKQLYGRHQRDCGCKHIGRADAETRWAVPAKACESRPIRAAAGLFRKWGEGLKGQALKTELETFSRRHPKYEHEP